MAESCNVRIYKPTAPRNKAAIFADNILIKKPGAGFAQPSAAKRWAEIQKKRPRFLADRLHTQTRSTGFAPPKAPRFTAETLEKQAHTARLSRSLLLFFGALLSQHAKRPRFLADKLHTQTRSTGFAPPKAPRFTAETLEKQAHTARLSRSLLLFFGALLSQHAKRPRFLAAF